MLTILLQRKTLYKDSECIILSKECTLLTKHKRNYHSVSSCNQENPLLQESHLLLKEKDKEKQKLNSDICIKLYL